MTNKPETLSDSRSTQDVASERRAFRDEHERSLREFDAKMDDLVKRALGIGAEFRADFDEEAVSEKRKRFASRLAGLREASGDAWSDLKKGVDDSWDELEDAFGDFRKGVNSAIGRFREGRKS